MNYGISVYITPEFSVDKSIKYIETAKSLGYDTLFTSLHLPEVNYKDVIYKYKVLLKIAKEQGMIIIADIARSTMDIFGGTEHDLTPFRLLNIDILRVDYGFSYRELISMSNNNLGIKIQLNASTLSQEDLIYLDDKGVNWNNITSCHNFYPRPDTGLSYSTFIKKSKMLKELGLQVWSFVPSQIGMRGPLFEGLPTLEIHRKVEVYTAARHLAYTGLVDGIIFGDAYANKRELEQVASVDNEIMEINIDLTATISEKEKEIIFLSFHSNRKDSPEYIIRSEKSRGYARKGRKIKPNNCIKREAFSVTIDNEGFNRYSGELQIILKDMPSDPRINVVGEVCEDEYVLVKQITSGRKFRFRRR